jgi:flagellar hook protein FlgE
MYTSITGLKNHQAMLDTTANNIANVNTYGFKASRMTFKDLLSQQISGTSQPTAVLGGTNSKQVGLGMQVESTQQLMTQGNIATTGQPSDLAINGDGFFMVTPDASQIPNMDLAATPPVTIPTAYTRAGNFVLDANGDLVTQEGYHVIGIKEGAGPPPTGAPTAFPPIAGQFEPLNIPPGTTKSWSIGQDGKVTRIDNTGAIQTVGWIVLAKFSNPAGLQPAGGNKWVESTNSGGPGYNVPGDGWAGASGTGLGIVQAGSLEMSNVDLASEFTDMIRAQRGFQANSRVITTSDEILQELVNLKR